MTDWLHCNTCFVQPGDGTKFLLTNCGHIYCEKCSQYACSDKCKMCGSPCTTIVLSGQMKPDVEVYFTSPQDLLKKSFNMLKQTVQVMDFQQNHRRRFMSHFREQLNGQQIIVEKAQKSLSHYQELEREFCKVKEENSYLKRLINEKGLGGYTRPLTSGPSGRQSPSYRASPTSSPHQNLVYTSKSSIVPVSQKSQHHTSHIGLSQSSGNTPGLLNRLAQRTTPGSADRITVRTPPSGGKMGTIRRTPSPQSLLMHTPKSVPHPIPFNGLQTPSPR